ncbi:MAG: hypothetical protein PHS97_04920 [Oscillospiraceae bacterium]|nr:hypothetical protein [Oscillospiraceae bacterium]
MSELLINQVLREASGASLPIIDAAVSGGSLPDYLRDALHRANGQLCARISPVRLLFPLPAPSGDGFAVSAEFTEKFRAAHPSFYAEAFVCNYGFYPVKDRIFLFLFDDARSLREKVALVQSLGFPAWIAPAQ